MEARDSASLVMELMRDAAELVRESSAELMDARSEPVAVDSCDSRDDWRLPVSLVMDATSDVTWELMDESTELARERAELVAEAASERTELTAEPAELVTWAEATEARAKRKRVQRILKSVCGGCLVCGCLVEEVSCGGEWWMNE